MFTTPFAFMAAPAGGGYDPDAQAFFDRVSTAGGSLTTTEKNATNQLVLDLKSYSIWTDLQAVYPFVGGSNASCRQNLISSSFTGTFYGTWSFSASGADPNGTDAYFDTGWNPSVVSSISNNHYGVYTTADETTTTTFGVFGGPSQRHFAFVDVGGQTAPEMGDAFVVWNNLGITKGFLFASADTGTLSAYLQNVSQGTESYGGSVPNGNFWFAARNGFPAGESGYGFMNANHTFATLGYKMNSTKAGNYYTAVQAFQTTLGRQV